MDYLFFTALMFYPAAISACLLRRGVRMPSIRFLLTCFALACVAASMAQHHLNGGDLERRFNDHLVEASRKTQQLVDIERRVSLREQSDLERDIRLAKVEATVTSIEELVKVAIGALALMLLDRLVSWFGAMRRNYRNTAN